MQDLCDDERANDGSTEVVPHARRVESQWATTGSLVPEAVHDGLLTSHGGAHRDRARLHDHDERPGRAFPRSPMIVAHAAWDLAERCRAAASSSVSELAGARQHRASLLARPGLRPCRACASTSTPFSAIFDLLAERDASATFEGEHYVSSTRMQPFFKPDPHRVRTTDDSHLHGSRRPRHDWPWRARWPTA